jgi:superfamily II DNA or RNA helicase
MLEDIERRGRQGGRVASQQRSSEHTGRALELQTSVLAPLFRRGRSVIVLLVRPDAQRAFAWAAELRRGTQVTLLVLAREADRRGWQAMLATGGVERPIDVGAGNRAVTDGAVRLGEALAAGDVRAVLLDPEDPVARGRPGDVLVVTDEDGTDTVVHRWHAEDPASDVERIMVLDGQEVPRVVQPVVDELRHAADRLEDRMVEGGATPEGDELAGVVLRDYQRDAVEAWLRAGRRGVLSMATGSGKTVTAIACTHRVVRSAPGDGLVIAVTAPLIHLVEQWADEFERLLGTKAIRCHTSRAEWLPAATNSVNLVRSGSRPVAVLAATHDTAALAEFTELLRPVRPASLMIIADESHHLDAERTALLPQQAGMRLGLTATPADSLDDDERVVDYLGAVVTEYSLSRAIADGVLCPYEYVPVPVRLTDGELEEFTRVSDLLASALQAPTGRRDRLQLERLMQQRADLLDSATGKIRLLSELLDQGPVRHTIIYCAGREQLAAAQKVCWDKGINAHPFTGEESAAERRSILEGFASERIPALAAIRCLDEGVDVPPARRAIMLRSSANPTQSVQRRGRLLRRHEGKTHAIIEDLVAVGPDGAATPAERDRVRLFAADAMNVDEAVERLLGAGHQV